MPPYFGRFISEQIYENKLNSFAGHKIKDGDQCCYLVDADDGSEEKDGTSYIVCTIFLSYFLFFGFDVAIFRMSSRE
jgi:hypothetical protein